MARAQFDRNEVIDRSIDLFWEHGFNASSMQQVVKATGLKPGSIYLSFGNKEALFREALETYATQRVAMIRKTIEDAPSIGVGICIILDAMVEESTKKDYCSCFLVKTQLELAHDNQTLHELAGSKLATVEATMKSYLEREYDEETSEDRAASIMLHVYGLRVYGYQKRSADRIRKGLRDGLPWLPWAEAA